MTFVRVRLALDALAPGATLTVRIKDTPANEPFFNGLKTLGHTVLARAPVGGAGLDVVIRHAG